MDITFSCTNCGKHLVVDQSGAGLSVPCPKCGTSLTIPAPPVAEQTSGQDLFHVSIKGEIKGPYTPEEVAELYYRGLVQSDTVCCKNDSEHWHAISEAIPMLKYAQPAPSRSHASTTPAGTPSRKSAATSTSLLLRGLRYLLILVLILGTVYTYYSLETVFTEKPIWETVRYIVWYIVAVVACSFIAIFDYFLLRKPRFEPAAKVIYRRIKPRQLNWLSVLSLLLSSAILFCLWYAPAFRHVYHLFQYLLDYFDIPISSFTVSEIALLCLSVSAIVMAHGGLRQLRQPLTTGDRLAVGSLIVGYTSLTVLFVRAVEYRIWLLSPILLLISVVAVVGCAAFWLWMLVDCATKERSDTNDKIVWLLIILFLNLIGALLYYFIRRQQRLAERRI